MKAIVLAAGMSSRFHPFGRETHKTMIKIMGKPILEYTLIGIKDAGIKEIVVIVRNDGKIKEYFGDGKKFGLSIKYVVQKEPTGMGDALLGAKDYIDGDFVFIGGNHVNSKSLIEKLKSEKSPVALVQKRENTWEYGVVKLKNDKVVAIVEKPEIGKEPSKYCLVSAYLLPREFINVLEKTKNHEHSFENALDSFSQSKDMKGVITEEEIATLKYPWDLLKVKNMLLKNIKREISPKASISESAEVSGEVVIEDGAQIMEGAKIKGPCYIGKGVVVGTNAVVRNGCCLEENSVVGAFMEIKNTLLMQGATTHSGYIGDCVIGKDTKIGASFTTANLRLDRETVKVEVRNIKVDSGLKRLGAVIGNNVKIGIKASSMPGVIIGNNAIIGSSTSVLKNVPDDFRYYTKFQEIVETPLSGVKAK